MKVSLVSTILNDRDGAVDLLSDLRAQTRFPDEFVVLDGGSRDGTFELLNEQALSLPFKLTVLQEKGANVSRGRNLAIEAAEHEVILTTDFGCRLDSRWVEKLVEPFEKDPSVEIVTGSWKIRDEDLHTPVQWAEWALSGGKIEFVATETCLASTRSLAYKRQVWRDFGTYPEDLTLAGDDAIFSLWMVAAKRKIAAAPEAMCYWHRFSKLKSYLKEARRNFRGAGEAIFFLSYGVKVGITFALETISLLTLLGAAIALPFGFPFWAFLVIALMTTVLWSKRVVRWVRSSQILKRAGQGSYWPWVVALESGQRYNGVLGYWEGFFHGFRHCQLCRERMKRLNVKRW